MAMRGALSDIELAHLKGVRPRFQGQPNLAYVKAFSRSRPSSVEWLFPAPLPLGTRSAGDGIGCLRADPVISDTAGRPENPGGRSFDHSSVVVAFPLGLLPETKGCTELLKLHVGSHRKSRTSVLST